MTDAEARFFRHHDAGIRRWVCRRDCELLEVVEVVQREPVGLIRVRTPDGNVYGYTVRSSVNWEPVEDKR